MTETVAILGSTGSVGVNTLEVIRLHPDRYRVTALAANTNCQQMFEQCLEFKPDQVVLVDHSAATRLRTMLTDHGLGTEVYSGVAELDALVADGIDSVVCAIVGAAGLSSTLSAVRAGAKVLVANKEPLVMLGSHIMNLARQCNAVILPLDSEHNAMFQCLPTRGQKLLGIADAKQQFGIRRLLLTGSGGPFRTLDPAEFAQVTPEQACAHPNWQMGPKISVDSATMMNKGLELIEACALFSMHEKDIEIVVHPQSVVHSMVEYVDGSVLAQMANPDMKVPIANALAWPNRIDSGAASLDLFSAAKFDFEPPDVTRFPALKVARETVRAGGTAPAILNAANEVAVQKFLDREVGFHRISELVEETMAKLPMDSDISLEAVIDIDQQARAICGQLADVPRTARPGL